MGGMSRPPYFSILVTALAYLPWTAVIAQASTPVLEADVILTDVKIYASPSSPPMPKGTVWIEDGRIVRIAPRLELGLDHEALVVHGEGRTLVAGFWNSHVHFTPPSWTDPRGQNDEQVTMLMTDMLLRYGFTSVVDTGSDPAWLTELKKRIESGLLGPRILAAVGSFVGENASPAYLDFKLPELATPKQAEEATREALRWDPEGIKIFTGSFTGPGQALHMSQPVVDTITRTAHADDVWVIAHPQSLRGMELAVDGDVDILAHTAPDAGPLSAALVKKMVDRGVALIPTLQLWRFELSRGGVPAEVVDRFQGVGVLQLRDFAAAGGEVLFGTDVGYMNTFDPTEEYQKMAEAGLDFRAILAALTTAPARRFLGGSKTIGTVSEGEPADLVLLAGDPADDPSAFARVDLVLRDGRVMYGTSSTESEKNSETKSASVPEPARGPCCLNSTTHGIRTESSGQ